MRYKIAKFCAYTPFVLYALEFVIKSFEFGIFVWFALIVLSVGGLLFSVLAWVKVLTKDGAEGWCFAGYLTDGTEYREPLWKSTVKIGD